MMVRLKAITKTSPSDYRLTLEVVDPDRQPWEPGDCLVRVDLHDGPARHASTQRGPLKSVASCALRESAGSTARRHSVRHIPPRS
jgi:hypothetical protein